MSDNNSYVSPLNSRYASKEMQYIFSPDKKFKTWRRLWIALAKSEQELGLPITDEQIAELEKEEEENKKKMGSSNTGDFSKLSMDKIDEVTSKKELHSDIDLNKEFSNNLKIPTYNTDDLKKIVEPDDKDAVKINEDINNIIKKIEDEDVSDDQFFDDFFFDE